MDDLDRLRYPIGRFVSPQGPLDPRARAACIAEIEEAPSIFRSLAAGLDDRQLDSPYRPGGWTIRQVVHHVPDSHMNAYIRTKLALTEETPTIKPYDEARWSELLDARTAPIEMSLQLLETLHSRWVLLLRSLSEGDFNKTFVHPDVGRVTLHWLLALYAWHGKHHAAHIRVKIARS